MRKIKNFTEFVQELSEKKDDNNKVSIEDVNKIIEEKDLKDIKFPHPLSYDKWIYRSTIIILGLIVLFVLGISAHTICCCGKGETPSGIIAIGATAVGALAGLMSLGNRKE